MNQNPSCNAPEVDPRLEIKCHCRCGVCCSMLNIVVSEEDAIREPRIRDLGKSFLTTNSVGESFQKWRLNSDDGPCVFFSRDENGLGSCNIHQTRPLVCRMFDCDHANPGY